MPTQEERLTTLERAITEYRPILRDITYELTMVKGLTVDQIKTIHELGQNINEVKENLRTVDVRFNHLEATLSNHTTKLNQIETMLAQILTRLPEQP